MNASAKTGRSRVDWDGIGAGRMNEFVSADELGALKAAGRVKWVG